MGLQSYFLANHSVKIHRLPTTWLPSSSDWVVWNPSGKERKKLIEMCLPQLYKYKTSGMSEVTTRKIKNLTRINWKFAEKKNETKSAPSKFSDISLV